MSDNASKTTITSKIKCSSKGSTRFAAPFKARVIEHSVDRYFTTVWFAIGLGISHVFAGAVVMATAIYSFHRGEFHAAVYSMAYHFFSAEAIMNLSYLNGWSTPMRFKHRKVVHIFLQLCAIFCAVIGTAVILVSKKLKTVHGITGALTLLLTILSASSGPFAVTAKNKGNVLIHVVSGIPCFFLSTICLSFGLVTEEFKAWAGPTVVYILLGFVIFYSAIIIITSLIKRIQRM